MFVFFSFFFLLWYPLQWNQVIETQKKWCKALYWTNKKTLGSVYTEIRRETRPSLRHREVRDKKHTAFILHLFSQKGRSVRVMIDFNAFSFQSFLSYSLSFILYRFLFSFFFFFLCTHSLSLSFILSHSSNQTPFFSLDSSKKTGNIVCITDMFVMTERLRAAELRILEAVRCPGCKTKLRI